jgi:hypothetical protein
VQAAPGGPQHQLELVSPGERHGATMPEPARGVRSLTQSEPWVALERLLRYLRI